MGQLFFLKPPSFLISSSSFANLASRSIKSRSRASRSAADLPCAGGGREKGRV
jgi:hypothetical protein